MRESTDLFNHELPIIDRNASVFSQIVTVIFWWKSIWIPNVQNKGKYHWQRHCLVLQIRPLWKIPSSVRWLVCGCCYGYCDNFIGGFSWVHLKLILFVSVTVRLQVSYYNPTQWLLKNKDVNAPIKFEEIVMVMIMKRIQSNLQVRLPLVSDLIFKTPKLSQSKPYSWIEPVVNDHLM